MIVADLSDSFCGAQVFRPEGRGRVIYADYDHVTAGFAATLPPEMDRLLVKGLSSLDSNAQPNKAPLPPVRG